MMDKQTKIDKLFYRFTMSLFLPLMAVFVVMSLIIPDLHPILSDALIAGFWMGLVAIAAYAGYVKLKK